MVMNSQTTISCVISGLTKQVDIVIWEKPNGEGVITHNVDGYKIEKGSYDSGSDSQTTVLTIPAYKNTADSVYKCVITSIEHAVSAAKTEVHSNVFSKYIKASFYYSVGLIRAVKAKPNVQRVIRIITVVPL